MARYKAVRDGLVGTHYVRAGEVFEKDGPAPSWACLIEEPVADESAEEKAVKKTAKKAKAAPKEA